MPKCYNTKLWPHMSIRKTLKLPRAWLTLIPQSFPTCEIIQSPIRDTPPLAIYPDTQVQLPDTGGICDHGAHQFPSPVLRSINFCTWGQGSCFCSQGFCSRSHWLKLLSPERHLTVRATHKKQGLGSQGKGSLLRSRFLCHSPTLWRELGSDSKNVCIGG